MSKKQTFPKQHIQALIDKRGMEASELADGIGITKSYMSKLINDKSPVTTALGLKIARFLNLDPQEVVELEFDTKLDDQALLGAALTWLGEAAESNKLELSHAEFSKWGSYVYKHALEQRLNFKQTKFFAESVMYILAQRNR